MATRLNLKLYPTLARGLRESRRSVSRRRAVGLALIGLGTWFAAPGCSRPPGDDEIRQKVLGTWIPLYSSTSIEIDPHGVFVTKWMRLLNNVTNELTYQGRWQVAEGSLVLTITNVNGPLPHFAAGAVESYKIVHLDDQKMEYRLEGEANLTTALRKSGP